MNKRIVGVFGACLLRACLFLVSGLGATLADEPESQDGQITAELDAYWDEVTRSVNEGDYAGYAATCHPLGVLVSGDKKTSYPLTQALQRWKKGFDDTRAGLMEASVEFRFSQRFHDETTAHETGIFRYSSTNEGKETVAYIHFEGLLRKSGGKWLILMEYQKSAANEEEWNALSRRRSVEKK